MSTVVHSTTKPISHLMHSIEHAVSVFDNATIQHCLHWLVNETEISHPILIEVLEKAADDPAFIARLTETGSQALSMYNLNPEEKGAIISGDIKWIETCVGPLTDRQKTWLMCRLQQEIW